MIMSEVSCIVKETSMFLHLWVMLLLFLGTKGWQGANTPLMIMHFSTGAKNHNLPEDCLLSNAVAPVLHVLMQGQVNVRLEAADPAMNLVCAVCSNTSPQFHDELQLNEVTLPQRNRFSNFVVSGFCNFGVTLHHVPQNKLKATKTSKKQ